MDGNKNSVTGSENKISEIKQNDFLQIQNMLKNMAKSSAYKYIPKPSKWLSILISYLNTMILIQEIWLQNEIKLIINLMQPQLPFRLEFDLTEIRNTLS